MFFAFLSLFSLTWGIPDSTRFAFLCNHCPYYHAFHPWNLVGSCLVGARQFGKPDNAASLPRSTRHYGTPSLHSPALTSVRLPTETLIVVTRALYTRRGSFQFWEGRMILQKFDFHEVWVHVLLVYLDPTLSPQIHPRLARASFPTRIHYPGVLFF